MVGVFVLIPVDIYSTLFNWRLFKRYWVKAFVLIDVLVHLQSYIYSELHI